MGLRGANHEIELGKAKPEFICLELLPLCSCSNQRNYHPIPFFNSYLYPYNSKTMKSLFAFAVAVICFFTGVFAQTVEKFTINENTYYGTKAIPKEITGLYKYQKTKEPIVEINEDGTGYFQVHDVPKYPVEFWIETDENGTIQKRSSEVNNNYQVVLVLKYGSNGLSGWQGAKAGTFDRIDVTMAFTDGYAIILGERFRKLL